MIKFSITILLIGCALSKLSHACDNNLIQLLNKISTLEANFTQSISNDNQQLLHKSTGKIYLSKPGKLRWEVKKPSPQIILLNNKHLWIYQPELQQVVRKSITEDTTLENPAIFLTENLSEIIKSKFTIDCTNRSNNLQYNLIPKNHNSTYKIIKLNFSNKNLHSIIFDDRLGNHITIKLQRISYNKFLPKEIFTLSVPSNTDTINY